MKIVFSEVCTVVMLLMVSAHGHSDDKLHKDHNFFTRLSSFNEVHFVAGDTTVTPIVPPALRGAISTKASGTFSATLNKSGDMIDYVLSYKDLEGAVTQSHIHFGQRHTVGGIVIWLCQTAGTQAPVGVRAVTPICPTEGTVTGTILANQVLAQTAQGVAAGEFDEIIRAIRAGAAYANVHTTLFSPGEIRGQIKSPHKHRE